jgi:hypothetical protein
MLFKYKKLLTSETGKCIISILLGLGLASLFKITCKGKNCMVFKAPNPENIDGKVLEFDDKCYKYKKVNTACNNSKKIVQYD